MSQEVHFRCYDEITPGVREEAKPLSIYMWCDEPQDNYFGGTPEVAVAHEAQEQEQEQEREQAQASRSPTPTSPVHRASEAAPLKVSPATQKR